MTAVMVAIECTCLAFLLVDLIAYIVLPHSGLSKRDGLFLCLVSLVAGLIFDIIAWIGECVALPQWLQYSSNTLCLMSSGLITAFFAYYIVGSIREQKSISWVYARVIALLNFCGSAIVLVAAICGKLYNVVPYPEQPGIFIYFSGGFAYDLPNYLAAFSLVFLCIIVLCNAKVLGKKKLIVFSIYFLAPMLASGLELIDENLQFSYAITCLNMSIVYVVLQSRHMTELLVREKLLKEWSYLDSLTGLLNRRAFDRDLEAVTVDSSVSVVFCDLNGLKKVNDEEGHHAGDEYLLRFSSLLTKHFSSDCVYRISGDEFVVIDCKDEKEQFDNRFASLQKEVAENGSMAALGVAKGAGLGLTDLVKEAETRMYDDKERFYLAHTDLQRRRTETT